MADTTDFFASYARHQAKLTQANIANKTRFFEALAGTDITRINVIFDGEGDSGQIEEIAAWSQSEQCPLPDTSVRLLRTNFGNDALTEFTLTLREAVETLCYDFLQQEQGGWENNDGAYGEFEFDIAQRTIELEFNGRYSDVSTNNYSF
jgi:hypothetical protein